MQKTQEDFIDKAPRARPFITILLTWAVGAFSPFSSCGVIPLVAVPFIGDVPIAPEMTFLVASPSLDPGIFFLSVSTIGRDLAVWPLPPRSSRVSSRDSSPIPSRKKDGWGNRSS